MSANRSEMTGFPFLDLGQCFLNNSVYNYNH
nr:MAG TPA: hypothetical protein [Caudoviricetes sp.]